MTQRRNPAQPASAATPQAINTPAGKLRMYCMIAADDKARAPRQAWKCTGRPIVADASAALRVWLRIFGEDGPAQQDHVSRGQVALRAIFQCLAACPEPPGIGTAGVALLFAKGLIGMAEQALWDALDVGGPLAADDLRDICAVVRQAVAMLREVLSAAPVPEANAARSGNVPAAELAA